MERQYYVETENQTSQTSSRLEAQQIAAEWARRGYDVTTVVVDVTDDYVETTEVAETASAVNQPARRRSPRA
jgi:hypothetical protein